MQGANTNFGNFSTVNPNSHKMAKVVIGFTTTPEFKLKLADEATALKMTLSALVELRLLNFHQNSINQNTNATQKDDILRKRVNELENKLAQYENNQLREIYNAVKNETHIITTVDNQEITINIQSMFDTYLLLLNSFTLSNP